MMKRVIDGGHGLLCAWMGIAAMAALAEDVATKPGVSVHAHAHARPELAIGATLDPAGNLWLARVQDRRLLVAQSADGGKHFSTPVAVTPMSEEVLHEGENRPKIAIASDGKVHLTWTMGLGKSMTGHIRYARSTDGGRSFSTPVILNEDRQEVSHRFDALAIDGKDHVAVVWLDARERSGGTAKGAPATGVGLYAAVSQDGGATFGRDRRIVEHTCQCCRAALVWTQDGPRVLWRHVFGDNLRDFALADLDGGAMRRVTDDDWHLEGCPHHGGDLAVDVGGNLHLTWFTQGKRRQGAFYRRVGVSGEAGAPMQLGDPSRHAEHALVSANGKRVLVSWREFDGQQFSAWAMRSDDGGSTWSAARRLAVSAHATDYPLPLIDQHQTLVVWNTAAEGLRVLSLSDTAS